MITCIDDGSYSIHFTNNKTRILRIHEQSYAWIPTEHAGDILVYLTKSEEPKKIISTGLFRIYTVADEGGLVDMTHLELCNGHGSWHGYLLPTGLPTKENLKNRIITTHEVISKSLS